MAQKVFVWFTLTLAVACGCTVGGEENQETHAADAQAKKAAETTEADQLTRETSDPDRATENAALQYWLAFALMPNVDEPLDSATTDNPEYGFGVPVSQQMATYFQRGGEAALRHLHRGAKLSHCNWGTDLRNDGPAAAAPYAQKAHELARVALLRSRWRFEHDQWQEGIGDVIATMVLGRHIGRGKIHYTINFGCMLETMSIATLGVYLPRMPRNERDILSKRLDSLPRFTSMREVFLHYEKQIDWAIDNFRKADREDRLAQFMDSLGVSEESKPSMKAKSADQLVALTEQARPLLRSAADALLLPPAEYDRLFRERFQPQLNANPLATILGPGYELARGEESTAQCRLVMLKTAIDVFNRGKSALSDHPDPYGEGPFELLEFADGFRLISRLVYCDNHAQMDFGLQRTPADTNPPDHDNPR